jgi:pimeloyl-ACP methyl ester carboxylesterase
MEIRTFDGEHGQITYWIDPDASAVPLIYHHGMPGAGALMPSLVQRAREAGFTLIQPIRPGYGSAAIEPGYTVMDLARRSTELALSMGPSFATIGLSAGGPYAMATAATAGSALLGGGVMAGVGPVYDPMLAETPEERAEWEAEIAELPVGRDAALESLTPRREQILADMAAGFPEALAAMPEADRDSIVGERRDFFHHSVAFSLEGGVEGWADDAIAIYTPWQIPYDEVVAPMQLHYGTADGVVPPSHGRINAAFLPKADVHIHEGHGHYSITPFAFGLLVDWLATLT